MIPAAQLKMQKQDSSSSDPGNPSLREVSVRNPQGFPMQLSPGAVPVPGFYGAAPGIPAPWPSNPPPDVHNPDGTVNTEIKIATMLQASTAQTPDPVVLQAAASVVHQAQANTAEDSENE